MNDTILTIIGNTTADVELRYTRNGKPVASGTIASTPRTEDRARVSCSNCGAALRADEEARS